VIDLGYGVPKQFNGVAEVTTDTTLILVGTAGASVVDVVVVDVEVDVLVEVDVVVVVVGDLSVTGRNITLLHDPVETSFTVVVKLETPDKV
jgi:hypothetical protein